MSSSPCESGYAGDLNDGSGLDVETAFGEMWDRLARPFEVVHTVSAMTGLSPVAVSQLVGIVVTSSPEAHELIEGMPKVIRSLATSIHTSAERCIGELRGPVLWSETMSARASSFGDPDLFICSTPSRAYDIDENRVLTAALAEVGRGHDLAGEWAIDHGHDNPLVADALHLGAEAMRYLDHPSLRNVSRRKPTSRAVKRTRSGKHKATYGPALALLERASNPLTPQNVLAWCDERTLAQIRLLVMVMRLLETSGRRLPDLRVEKGALYSGPVQYYHPRELTGRQTMSGIVVGQLLIDVPWDLTVTDRDLAQRRLAERSPGRRTMVIMDDDDVPTAIELAIDLATSGS